MTRPLKIGIVAGEVSGDILGGSLMAAISNQNESVEFYGIGGTSMQSQGLHELASMDQLSVNGFVDPILRLWPLFRLLQSLKRQLAKMDVVVGVDFNVFNLLLERGIKKRGVPTAHYVSPSVYAWRRGRIKRIGKATDVVMALFPFEIQAYRDQAVRADFVGHPTADRFDPKTSKEQWLTSTRTQLNLPSEEFVLTVMPGSRRSELNFHFEIFLSAANRFKELASLPSLKVMIPTVHDSIYQQWEALQPDFSGLDVEVTRRPASEVLAASDLALIKSGTSTLEAMLVKTPMVVAYRVGAMTARIVRRMLKTDYVALPNILAREQLVPELLQDDASVENLAMSLLAVYRSDSSELHATFQELHQSLKQGAARRAAEVVLSLVSLEKEASEESVPEVD